MFDGNSFYFIDFELSDMHFFVYDIMLYIFNDAFRLENKTVLNDYLSGIYDEKLEKIFKLNGTPYNKNLRKVYLLVYVFEQFSGKIVDYYFDLIYFS